MNKTVSCRKEFTIELVAAIPYAYWLYKNNLLEQTVSCKDTKCFYYFSPNHQEKWKERDYWFKDETEEEKLPIGDIHIESPDFESQWLLPPYKEKYQNDIFVFDKPLLIVSNKYNMEWNNKKPIHYFDCICLYDMLIMLKDKYQIIYNRAGYESIVGDNSKMLNLHEHQL